ncbi:YutD family protein [Bacillaceae bacterium]
MIYIQGIAYELIEEHKNGWNAEAFRDRYSEILHKYDYIVGDWGYGQLRLRGFYRDHAKAPVESRISFLDVYLREYCNFGCAYFVLRKLPERGKEEGNNR